MTRIWLGAVLVVLFASCGKSLEEKANALIKENMTKVLYYPESYDPVETRIDSAFTPFDDPVFFEKTLQLYKLNMSIDEYDRNMKRAKYSMSICGDSYMSAYVRNRYQESKDEYDQNAQDKEIAEKKSKETGRRTGNCVEERTTVYRF